ncbi:MAG: GNA1162 family protein [Pseudomonadota bacterium]|nr:GNA1162 family protein [Pseudomonadota bacterium]
MILNRNRSLKIAGILLLSLIASGCVTTPPTEYLSKQEAYGNFYEEKPKTVLVVPAINHSTAADAGNYYAATVAEPLTKQGFYVLPIAITDQILNEAGISDGAQLRDVPLSRLGTLFGCDAVLYVTITLWDTNYSVMAGNVVVELNYRMVSTKTSEPLWVYQNKVVVNTTGSSNNGLVGMLIETAIKTAQQDYLPVAQMVNNSSMHTIPAGQYHTAFGKDAMDKVVNPNHLPSQE